MADVSDQIRKIATPADTNTAAEIRRQRQGTRFAICVAAILILLPLAAIALTLTLSMFKLKGPNIQVVELSIGEADLVKGTNMTLNAVVWVRNLDFASFEYNNLTTTVVYRGAVVGEARGQPGRAGARRTTRVNVTVDVMTRRLITRPGFDSDLISGLINVSSYTRVGGRMDVLLVFEKKLTVRMNCNMTLNITNRVIEHHKCKRKVKL